MTFKLNMEGKIYVNLLSNDLVGTRISPFIAVILFLCFSYLYVQCSLNISGFSFNFVVVSIYVSFTEGECDLFLRDQEVLG